MPCAAPATFSSVPSPPSPALCSTPSTSTAPSITPTTATTAIPDMRLPVLTALAGSRRATTRIQPQNAAARAIPGRGITNDTHQPSSSCHSLGPQGPRSRSVRCGLHSLLHRCFSSPSPVQRPSYFEYLYL